MHEIQIPKTIQVGGFNYDIDTGGHYNEELSRHGHWAEHSAIARNIRLDTTMKPQQASKTFIHEVLHAINMIYSNESLAEEEVQNISQGVFQVMEQLGIRFVLPKGK